VLMVVTGYHFGFIVIVLPRFTSSIET
jgi:hypothetical protein